MLIKMELVRGPVTQTSPAYSPPHFVWSAESIAIYPSAVLLLKLCGCLLTVMHFFPILSVLVDFCLHYTVIII